MAAEDKLLKAGVEAALMLSPQSPYIDLRERK